MTTYTFIVDSKKKDKKVYDLFDHEEFLAFDVEWHPRKPNPLPELIQLSNGTTTIVWVMYKLGYQATKTLIKYFSFNLLGFACQCDVIILNRIGIGVTAMDLQQEMFEGQGGLDTWMRLLTGLRINKPDWSKKEFVINEELIKYAADDARFTYIL
jgi:hypothetical protein